MVYVFVLVGGNLFFGLNVCLYGHANVHLYAYLCGYLFVYSYVSLFAYLCEALLDHARFAHAYGSVLVFADAVFDAKPAPRPFGSLYATLKYYLMYLSSVFFE